MRMKLTKMYKAKVIVTALYNLPQLVTEDNIVAWKSAKRMVRKLTTEQIDPQYQLAHKILTEQARSK